MAGVKNFKLTDEEMLAIVEQLRREEVAPRFNEWRKPYRYKIAYGGRGAGAKSRSASSLLVQFAEHPQYFGESLRVMCTRHVQNSIDESSKQMLWDTVKRLGYKGWVETKTYIENRKNDSVFFFKGLNDMAADDYRGLENIDVLFAEEAAPIEKAAWNVVLPTMRKKGSEIWALFNRDKPRDPVYELFVEHPRPNSCILDLKPGEKDNPWFKDSELPAMMAHDYEVDPDEAAHIWEGLPRTVGAKALYPAVKVLGMARRNASDEGAREIGCDVARFGKDKTQAFMRKGMRVIKHEERSGADTIEVAGMLWDMAGRDPTVAIKVDVGYNPGVVDTLVGWGANVIPVGFGDAAKEPDKYANAAAEMYFTLPVDEIGIPEEFLTRTLIEDLTERTYSYDNKGRKKIEPKDGQTDTDGKKNFKARHGGRSPDEGDALVLAFYERSVQWALL